LEIEANVVDAQLEALLLLLLLLLRFFFFFFYVCYYCYPSASLFPKILSSRVVDVVALPFHTTFHDSFSFLLPVLSLPPDFNYFGGEFLQSLDWRQREKLCFSTPKVINFFFFL